MNSKLREYSTGEIKNMVIQLKARNLENRFKAVQGEITNTSVFRETRRMIARLLTILRERGESLVPSDWRRYSDIVKGAGKDVK